MNMHFRIEIEKKPKSETVEEIRNGLISHNLEKSNISEGADLAIKAYSDKGKLVGGVVAWYWGSCLEIKYLWISEKTRGEKLGTELLNQLESFLSGSPPKTIITNTFSFQAPEFYLKNGFTVTDEVLGYPDSIKKYFLKKTIV